MRRIMISFGPKSLIALKNRSEIRYHNSRSMAYTILSQELLCQYSKWLFDYTSRQSAHWSDVWHIDADRIQHRTERKVSHTSMIQIFFSNSNASSFQCDNKYTPKHNHIERQTY